MKYLLLVIAIPLVLFVSIFLSLVLGSLIRHINEGDRFKSPLDDHRPMPISLKDKEFRKTLLTGFFVYFTLLIIAKYLSAE
ncbi:hypothetical protein A0O34_05240 [Chryseobacterium glaciei]|uniref:Uncharacterized protein n=1 Tax=Chryseobacterium glaciei TaxID=1685010 RepID=A0A172XSH3_9FLAO|nr:hypothetical protein A0O34_05240 [Chryseobacterium glaciei]